MLTLRFESPMSQDHIEAVREQLQRACEAMGLDEDLKAILVSMADELCCNIMEHSGASWMELTLDLKDSTPKAATLTLRDDGTAFDPVDSASYFDEPFLVQGVDRHLGLWMMSPLIPELEYRRIDERINQLVFTRSLA